MKHLNSQPLVSVIMPVYNAEGYLAEAINSIVAQTYKNFELIIVDDASTDSSWNIIQTFKKKYPNQITAIHMKNNMNCGGDSCANIAYHHAKGEFIARMDADDIAVPERLEKQVAFLKAHPSITLTGSQAYVIDKNGKITGEKTVPTSHDEIYKNYFVFHPMIHPTMMMRKCQLPKRKDLYKIKYPANNDLYTFFDLLKHGMFANMEEKLLLYRVHGKNDSLIEPKQRFMNTLKIRINEVLYNGYRPTVKAVITTLIQSMVVFFLPEKLIVPIYMMAKGISKPTIQLPVFPLRRQFATLKRFAFS